MRSLLRNYRWHVIATTGGRKRKCLEGVQSPDGIGGDCFPSVAMTCALKFLCLRIPPPGMGFLGKCSEPRPRGGYCSTTLFSLYKPTQTRSLQPPRGISRNQPPLGLTLLDSPCHPSFGYEPANYTPDLSLLQPAASQPERRSRLPVTHPAGK